MRIVAVPKARALAMIELDSLNPGGKVRLADCVGPIASKYKFLKYPKDIADFDIEKGIRFESGKAGDLTIDAFVIYGQALVLDSLSSTSDSQLILLEMLEWSSAELGLRFEPEMVSRWGFINHLIFDTDFSILRSMSHPLHSLAEKISGVTNEIFGELPYEPGSVYISHDPLIRKNAIASFLIHTEPTRDSKRTGIFLKRRFLQIYTLNSWKSLRADILDSRR